MLPCGRESVTLNVLRILRLEAFVEHMRQRRMIGLHMSRLTQLRCLSLCIDVRVRIVKLLGDVLRDPIDLRL